MVWEKLNTVQAARPVIRGFFLFVSSIVIHSELRSCLSTQYI